MYYLLQQTICHRLVQFSVAKVEGSRRMASLCFFYQKIHFQLIFYLKASQKHSSNLNKLVCVLQVAKKLVKNQIETTNLSKHSILFFSSKIRAKNHQHQIFLIEWNILTPNLIILVVIIATTKYFFFLQSFLGDSLPCTKTKK